MTPRPADEDEGGAEPTLITSTQRSRWATRKLTVKSSGLKRLSLRNRNNHGIALGAEKKRASGHSGKSDSTAGQSEVSPPSGDAGKDDAEASHTEPRTIFFGLPLADDFKDEEGNPTQQYPRNKIRTAKYTPLSFIPKNLWFQFHNIANIFFLFLVILVVSSQLPPPLPPLYPLSLWNPLPPADLAPCLETRASNVPLSL